MERVRRVKQRRENKGQEGMERESRLEREGRGGALQCSISGLGDRLTPLSHWTATTV